MTETPKPKGLALLRAPFPANQISKLPKETGAQAKQRKAEQDAGKWPPKCSVCGGYHHAKAVHLDYVGHAALTDRLLDCDPHWYWEPYVAPGLPNAGNGMWIKLHVCGQSQIGYGHADGKQGGDAIKEIIGDALRNAAMRFGAALDLWHKGDLHLDASEEPAPAKPAQQRQQAKPADTISDDQRAELMLLMDQLNVPAASFLAYGKLTRLDDLPVAHFNNAKKWIMAEAKRIEAFKAKTLADELGDEIKF